MLSQKIVAPVPVQQAAKRVNSHPETNLSDTSVPFPLLKSEAPGKDVSGYADRQEDLLDSRFMNYRVILFELSGNTKTSAVKNLKTLIVLFTIGVTTSTNTSRRVYPPNVAILTFIWYAH